MGKGEINFFALFGFHNIITLTITWLPAGFRTW